MFRRGAGHPRPDRPPRLYAGYDPEMMGKGPPREGDEAARDAFLAEKRTFVKSMSQLGCRLHFLGRAGLSAGKVTAAHVALGKTVASRNIVEWTDNSEVGKIIAKLRREIG